jgi:hypothetical protein
MSCVGNNYIVPSADPCSGGGGSVNSVNPGTNVTITGTSTDPIVNANGGSVNSVNPGTNVTITGTSTDPIVNANGGVTQITAGSGITIDPINGLGNVTISASNSSSLRGIESGTMTMPANFIYPITVYVGSPPNGTIWDVVVFTPKSVLGLGGNTIATWYGNINSGTNIISLSVFPELLANADFSYIVSYKPLINTYTWSDFVIPNGSTVNGGGIAINYGNLIIPDAISPIKNPTLTLTIVMCGIGTTLNLNYNNLFVGLFYDTNNDLALGYPSINDTPPSINWGTTIPNASTVTFAATFNTADLISNPLFASFFVSFPTGESAYQFDNLIMRVSTTYQP